jgi:hypothetical protein
MATRMRRLSDALAFTALAVAVCLVGADTADAGKQRRAPKAFVGTVQGSAHIEREPVPWTQSWEGEVRFVKKRRDDARVYVTKSGSVTWTWTHDTGTCIRTFAVGSKYATIHFSGGDDKRKLGKRWTIDPEPTHLGRGSETFAPSCSSEEGEDDRLSTFPAPWIGTGLKPPRTPKDRVLKGSFTGDLYGDENVLRWTFELKPAGGGAGGARTPRPGSGSGPR